MGCTSSAGQQVDGELGQSKSGAGPAAVAPCSLDPIPDLGGAKPKKLLIAIHGLADTEMDKAPDETPKTRCDRIGAILEGVEKTRGEVADLALFVAPETYYSHMGGGANRGRYDADEAGETIGRLQALGKAFPKLLLVPGSITWFRGPLKPRPEWKREGLSEDQKDRIHNTLPIIFGSESTTYHKKDDIDTSPHFPERFDMPPRKHGVVRAAGLLIGLSICGDSGQVDVDYDELSKRDPLGAKDIDVQIMIARGQALSLSKKLRDGGITVRADGMNSDDPEVRCGVTAAGKAVAPALTTGDEKTRVLYYGPFDL